MPHMARVDEDRDLYRIGIPVRVADTVCEYSARPFDTKEFGG